MRVWNTSQQVVLRGKIRKWVHASNAYYESYSPLQSTEPQKAKILKRNGNIHNKFCYNVGKKDTLPIEIYVFLVYSYNIYELGVIASVLGNADTRAQYICTVYIYYKDLQRTTLKTPTTIKNCSWQTDALEEFSFQNLLRAVGGGCCYIQQIPSKNY